jgi:hypothetical protein
MTGPDAGCPEDCLADGFCFEDTACDARRMRS